MLGMLKRPWADARYDDASLYTRFGYLIGHELAHHTLASPFVAAKLAPLVAEYPTVQHSEAVADIISAIAIIRSGKATPQQVCNHISQIWCARTAMAYQPDPQALHPHANARGDKLCKTLENIGLL